MASLGVWINAFRLRTLPLSVSGVVMGSFLALAGETFRTDIFLLAIATTLFLQILSNLANDYGDSQNGADNAGRIGPERMVQSGAISPGRMQAMILVFSALSLITGILLILRSGIHPGATGFFWLLGTGVAAILAALFYTMGRRPYGYAGLGDLFVLLFFGFFSVLGTYYVHALSLSLSLLLPAAAVGLLSVGVLNLNNMRDAENDRISGKKTFVVRMGLPAARYYHAFLVLSAFIVSSIYMAINDKPFWSYLFLLLLVPVSLHLHRVFRYKDPRQFDRELRILALLALAFTLLYGAGMNL